MSKLTTKKCEACKVAPVAAGSVYCAPCRSVDYEKAMELEIVETPEKVKHTGGPWRVAPYYRQDVVSDHRSICHGHSMTEESYANARLIAASPDMAQTLIEELDAIRVWLGAETNADITDGMFISIDKIQTSLRKAGLLQ